MDTYRTVAGRGETTLERRDSQFRGLVEPTPTVTAAKELIERVREHFPDATHVVPAYRIRVDGGDFLREYSRDDGEPSGSAGSPALNVLQGQDLENVTACVVRHHGGTDLGVGGLVSAYGESVKRAVSAAGTTTTRPTVEFTVTVDYDDSGTVRSVLESANVSYDGHYDKQANFEVEVGRETAGTLRERLRSATSDRVTIAESDP